MRNFLLKPVFGVAAAIYLAGGAIVAKADPLTLGDPAPPVVVDSFVKGAAINAVPAGKISVVEFWATWCGPCKQSIPHLTELAKKFPAVKFLGVSVWENDQKLVKPFVAQMGSTMDYSVAMDKVPSGANGQDGVMAKTWMAAAQQNGIPTAFIIGKDGKIDWIGHPMEMEEPLTKICAGDWDIAAAKVALKAKMDAMALMQARQIKMMGVMKDVEAAQKSGDNKQTLAVVDKAVGADPTMEEFLGTFKFNALRKEGDQPSALTYGDHLVSVVLKGNAEELNDLAWSIVDPKAEMKPTAAYAAFALKAAKAADDLSAQKDPAIADTYAAALFATGDAAGAVAAEERAIRIAKGTPEEKDPELAKNLAAYRKAVTATRETAKAQ